MAPQVGTSPEPKAPPERKAQAGTGPQVAKELAQIPYEPFLPVEGKLIMWSLVLGGVLLILLVWISYTFFAG